MHASHTAVNMVSVAQGRFTASTCFFLIFPVLVFLVFVFLVPGLPDFVSKEDTILLVHEKPSLFFLVFFALWFKECSSFLFTLLSIYFFSHENTYQVPGTRPNMKL